VVAKSSVVKAQARLNFASFRRQRARVQILDAWNRGEQFKIPQVAGESWDGQPYSPRSASAEYQDLMTRAPSPWGGLVVTTLAQTAYVDGVRRPGAKGELRVWDTWQENGWDARQIALHRDTIAHGLGFGVALPGQNPMTGARSTIMRGVSAKEMAAFYDEDGWDEWPSVVIWAKPYRDSIYQRGYDGWTVRLLDDEATHYLSCKNDGEEESDWTYISYETHGAGVTPVVQFSNRLDLQGRATGEIEPIIPLLRRVDQDTFDRLIVQRFGAWKVRYIAGMAAPEGGPEAEAAAALKLSVQDFLATGDPNAKFGTLDSTDVDQFIKAGDADLRHLAAVTQTPPHHLLGLSANLQAEALAAAAAGLMRKSGDFKTLTGESHEKFLRLVAHMNGDREEAMAFDMQVRWRDTESRSFAQTAQALSVVATGLHVPVEMLWERLPGWTDADSARAKDLIESGAIDALLEELTGGLAGNDTGQQQEQPDANTQ
jgi:hypothetical protein